jgi:regulator of protease activity HflC (stomatin/prohibitin superfamily)
MQLSFQLNDALIAWGLFLLVIGGLVGLVVLVLHQFMIVVPEHERVVVFSLGKAQKVLTPGQHVLWLNGTEWCVWRSIDIREKTVDIPPQQVVTKDNIELTVDAVLSYKVSDPIAALTQVANYHVAIQHGALSAIRSVIGGLTLQELLQQRTSALEGVYQALQAETDRWGLELLGATLKEIALPAHIQRALARPAEAEQERIAKLIQAQGEAQAAPAFAEAANTMASSPLGLQLRYLQLLPQFADNKASSILLPMPTNELPLGPLMPQSQGQNPQQGQLASPQGHHQNNP